jgi:hypothetical protein
MNRHRFFNELAKAGNKNSGLRIRASGSQSVNTSAFVGTNPTGELITPGLPVIRPELVENANGTYNFPERNFETALQDAAK